MFKKITDQPLSPGIRFTMLDWATLLGPALPVIVLGSYVLSYLGFFIGILLILSMTAAWGSILFSLGKYDVPYMHAMIVMRFNKPRTVLFAGLGYTNPFFDERAKLVSLQRKEFILGYDETGIKYELKDASVPATIKIAGGNGKLSDIYAENWPSVARDVMTFNYGFEKPMERVDTLILGTLKDGLRLLTLDEASTAATKPVCEDTARQVAGALKNIGWYLADSAPIKVEDIVLSPEQEASRNQMQAATNSATALKTAMLAPAQGILAVRNALKDGGMGISDEKILEMILYQQGLETIKNTGAHITFYGGDVQAIVKALGAQFKGG